MSTFCSFGGGGGGVGGGGTMYVGFDKVYFWRIMELALHKRFFNLENTKLNHFES